MTTEYTREVRFHAGYDKRAEPGGGARGATIAFVLRAPDGGAITAQINTGWMTHPRGRTYPGPGVDMPLADHYPTGGGIHIHHPLQVKDWWYGPDDCELVPGGKCYGDGGYLVSDKFLEVLVEQGDEAAWAWLENTYAKWMTPEGVTA